MVTGFVDGFRSIADGSWCKVDARRIKSMKQLRELTDEQVSEYKEQGWIVLPGVFSHKEIMVLERTSYNVLKEARARGC